MRRRAGSAFVTAIVLCALRIAFLRRSNRFPKYRLRGVARAVKCSAIVAALSNLLIVAFQVNARIASDASAFVTGTIAPFEWAGAAPHLLNLPAPSLVLAFLRCTCPVCLSTDLRWHVCGACVLCVCPPRRTPSAPVAAAPVRRRWPGRSSPAGERGRRRCVSGGGARRAEYGIGMVTWAMFTATFVVELDRYCPRRTWLLRFPVLFIFAGEVAKARCAPACGAPVTGPAPSGRRNARAALALCSRCGGASLRAAVAW